MISEIYSLLLILCSRLRRKVLLDSHPRNIIARVLFDGLLNPIHIKETFIGGRENIDRSVNTIARIL